MIQQPNDHEAEKAARWPSGIQQFWWDLLPARCAPENSGLVPPQYLDTPNINATSVTTHSLEVLRQSREEAESRATVAETKANRLAQQAVGLLGLSVGAFGIEAKAVHSFGAW